MEADNGALESKRADLQRIAAEALPQSMPFDRKVADAVVDAFVHITPPPAPEFRMELIVLSAVGSTRSGETRKLGNLLLNWRKLIDVVPDATIAGAGAMASPFWLWPFIALYLWNKVWCGAKEQLSEAEATVIFALWKARSDQKTIEEEEGFSKTNALRQSHQMPALKRVDYDAAVARLVRMGCIEIDDGVIWLREWVKATYE